MSPGKMKLTVCSESIVRVMYSPTATIPIGQTFVVTNSWTASPFQVADSSGSVTLSTAKLKVVVDKSTGGVRFYDSTDHLLLGENAGGGKTMSAVTVNGESTYQPQQSFDSPADEFIYGLGQYQEGIWNWRGMPQQLRQCNSQIAMPMIVSSYGYGLLWNNASLSDFNPADTQVPLNTNGSGTFTTGEAGDYVFLVKDGNRSGLIGVQVNGQTISSITNMWVPYSLCAKTTLPANTICSVTRLGGAGKIYFRPLGNTTAFRSEVGDAIDYYFFYGPGADQIVAGYRKATGDVPMLAKAAYGFWQCRERYSSQTQILDAASQFRARQIPVDFIVQDWQYWGNHGWGAYEWDASNYPDPASMIADLHTNHFKYMISVWSNPSGSVHTALASIGNGLIPNTTWMDVFNPAVRALRWQYMNSAFYSIGTDGWWQDATEPGDDGNSVSGVNCFAGSANRVRNAYPLFASQATYEGQRAADATKRVTILSRSGYPGQQRYGAAVWSGDVNGDWPTLRKQIAAGLNYSITGLPYWTTDTGGFFRPSNQYTSSDYNEVLTRWFQWSTFSPILRIHGYQTATEMWNWLPSTQTNLLAFDQLRYRMLPYNYSVAWMTTSQRYTIMRPLVMDFANDANALGISDEYMFGPAFLACPVTTPQATTRPVYLPAGTAWRDFWSGESLAGGQTVTANAPLANMPVYVRAGSIVPFGPALQYATEKAPDPVEVRVYPGANGQFTLYEDEGDSYAYEANTYATIPISWDDTAKTLVFGARQGSFPGMLASRTFHVVWVYPGHGTGTPNDSPADVTVTYTGNPVQVSIPAGDTSTPAAPVVTPSPGVKQISLAWNSVPAALSYVVKRSNTTGGPYHTVATMTSAAFTDTNVLTGITYYYVVLAANMVGQSGLSAEVTGMAMAAPIGPACYWDTNTSSGLQSGNGTWDAGTTAAWSAGSSGSNPLLAWTSNSDAFFQGGSSSTVTLSGTVLVHSITQSGSGTGTTITGNSSLQMGSGGGFSNGVPDGAGTLTISSPVTLTDSGVVVQAAQPIYISGTLADGGGGYGFNKTGNSTLTLRGTNNYTGATTISAGTLILEGSAPINAEQSSIAISAGAVLNLNATGVGGTPTGDTMGAALAQSGTDVTISGNGTLLITGTSTDVLGLGNASGRHVYVSLAAGGLIDVQGGIFRNGGWQTAYWTNNLAGINVAFVATFDVWDGNDIIADALTGSGKVINQSNSARTIGLTIGANGGSGLFSGVIGGGTRAGTNRIALTKVGSGTQTLSGANSYTGATTISGGVLNLTGSLAAGSAVAVNNGSTLAGTGTVGGTTTVAGGGIVAPGNGGAGTLNLATLTLNNGATLNIDLLGPTTSDNITLTGNLIATGTTTINLNALVGFTGAGSYPLITQSAAISAANFALGNIPEGYSCSLTAAAGTLSVVVGAPPAPSGLTATASDGQVALAWNASVGATGYSVLRSTASGDGYALAAGGNTTLSSFTDTTVINGTSYYYVVVAKNLGGISANSAQASAQPLSALQAWRLANFGTTNNTGSAADSADPDGDGWTNAQEFACGTNPNDRASLLRVNQMKISGSDCLLSFPTVIGKTYQLERSDTLQSGSWVAIQGKIPGTGGTVEVTDTGSAAQPKRFYRIVVTP